MLKSIPIAAHLIGRTIGSKRGIILNLLLPAILLAVITGLVSGSGDQKASIMISNQDQGSLGGYFEKAIARENLYDVHADSSLSEQMVKDAVLEGTVRASIYIPADYTERLLAGERPQALLFRKNEQLWNISLAASLQTEANKLMASADLLRAQQGVEADIALLTKLLDQQAAGGATASEQVMKLGQTLSHPETVGIILMFVMLLVGQSIGFVMEDREQRTMARMYAAPLRALDIAFGNFLGSLLVGTIQLTIILSFAYFIFGFMQGVSFGALLLVLECFLLAAVGLAMLIAGFVKNSAQLGQISNLFITPTCMISGCFWPLSIMPDFLQKLANFMPQKWAIQAIDRLGGGGSIADIGLQLGILLLFAVVLIGFGAAVLRPNRIQ